MKPATEPKRCPNFPGIARDAKTLGVSRAWLWRVLSGQANNPDLAQRYRQLKAAQAEAEASVRPPSGGPSPDERTAARRELLARLVAVDKIAALAASLQSARWNSAVPVVPQLQALAGVCQYYATLDFTPAPDRPDPVGSAGFLCEVKAITAAPEADLPALRERIAESFSATPTQEHREAGLVPMAASPAPAIGSAD
jgi:hypothetical protein